MQTNTISLCTIDSALMIYELYFLFDNKDERIFSGGELDMNARLVQVILKVEL